MSQRGMRWEYKDKGVSLGQKGILASLIIGFLFAAQPSGLARRPQDAGGRGVAESDRALSMEQEEALDLLARVSRELNSEASNADALVLQAHVAGKMWRFDESAARAVFASAFRAALRLSQEEDSYRDVREEARARRAAVVREIVRLYAAHDRKDAEAWIKTIEEASDEHSVKNVGGAASDGKAEVLAEIALDLVKTDPRRALQLGLQSLRGTNIPTAFGRLLFALRREKKELSDVLFRAALMALRRNGYAYDPALLALTNDVFDAEGNPLRDTSGSDAQLLLTFFADAVGAHVAQWRDARAAGGPSLSESSARMYTFLIFRALPILRTNDPEALPVVEPLLQGLSSGLNPSQVELQRQLLSSRTQQRRFSGSRSLDIETQLEEAGKEKDATLRDALLRGIALRLMRIDAKRALSAAEKITDAILRAKTLDDINLVVFAVKLRRGAYDEARQIALGINDVGLRARMLAELASAAIANSGDVARAAELLGEAKAVALRAEDSADKLQALLVISEKFSKIDVISAFDVLSSAVTTVNNARKKADHSQADSQPGRVTITAITEINGKEVTAGDKASLDSIDFKEAGALAQSDFTRARLLGEAIQDRVLRGKFLMAVASSVLDEPKKHSMVGNRRGVQ